MAVIGGTINITISNILSCSRRQNAENRKGLQFVCDNTAETSTLFKRHRELNMGWNNSGQRKDISKEKEMNGITDSSQKMTEILLTVVTYVANIIAMNNDKMEEQTAVAEIGTTSAQMTSTLTSTQSRGNLNPTLNVNHKMSKLESNADEKLILPKEKSWNSGHSCLHYCYDESLQNPIKHKICDKKVIKEMIGEYKLLESKSRLESEQDIYKF
uniref:Uncharacterized protein n=1 Tax=Wuchereria bancrofti TaxID=6293 RepID=A0AAF5PPU0_WUCBA